MLNSFGKECITKYLLDCRTRANRHIHYRIIRRTPKSQHWWTIYFLSCMLKNLYNFVVPYKLDIHSLFHFNTPLYLLTFSPTLLPCYCQFVCWFVGWLVRSFICSFMIIHSSVHFRLSICLFVHSSIHPFVCLFIHSFITYLFIKLEL